MTVQSTQSSSAPYSIEARKARWTKFMTPGGPPGFMFMIRYDGPDDKPDPPPCPPFRHDKKAERVDWALKCYERQLRRTEWLHDDFIPHVTPATGTEIFAEAFGCKVHFPDGSNPFALPLIRSASEVAAVKVPNPFTSTLATLFEIGDELHRKAGSDAVMRTVDIQSPMDIAALIWEKNEFYLGMVDAPEAVKELASKVHDLLTAFLDEWFRRHGVQHVAHYPDYFMNGGMTLSEDEIGSVNAEMFDEFFRDELVALSKRYGGIGIHCCARARHQWDNLRSLPGLRLLNLHASPSGPAEYIRDAFEYFDGGIAQMHYGWAPDGHPDTWPEKFPAGRKIVIDPYAGTKEEALRISAAFRATRERLEAKGMS